ncbi:unnamed protein product [Ilex paraguariensis]|uniref:BHLH domain-containing protein n=1 Tax=Ilex paraguariensis TaxID=185542 RepID=A0ABC8U876_9AQUA
MELTQHGLLEEILAPRRESWTAFPAGVNEFFSSGWSFESINVDNPDLSALDPSFLELISPTEPTFACPFNDLYPFIHGFPVPEISSSYDKNETPPILIQEEYPSMVEDGELFQSPEARRVEMEKPTTNISPLSLRMCGERKSKAKKVEGHPSKNLMAERRRRKRLNDRLSMLRSIVPKISKMDRTSILGDTIDYMKELLEKIHKLKEDDMKAGIDQMDLMRNLKKLKPNEMRVRNPPKFDIERKKESTRIDICCAAKPGLLLSTLNALEALGLDIQQCVISCFNDFALQASCAEPLEHQTLMNSEEIKQALFRNAGYGGRCL